MLQEKYLPNPDVSKRESIVIQAPVSKVYPLIENLNFRQSKIIYWLFKLRGIPVPQSLSLKGLEKLNFIPLESKPGEEIIIGLIGQFWTPTGRLKKFIPDQFTLFSDINYSKATWSFEVESISSESTRVFTETRILCPSEQTKKRFKLYWTFIQPFSSWIRRLILRSIKKEAEQSF